MSSAQFNLQNFDKNNKRTILKAKIRHSGRFDRKTSRMETTRIHQEH